MPRGRFRFSLRTLLLFSLFCGSAMLLWRNREPWGVYRTIREPKPLWNAGYSPRDRYFYTVVTRGPGAHTVKIYECGSGELRATVDSSGWMAPVIDTSLVPQYSISPREKYFLRVVRPPRVEAARDAIWRIDTSEALQLPNAVGGKFHVALISPNDNFALVGIDHRQLSLVKLPSMEVVAVMPRGTEGFFSPDEQWLAFYDTRVNHNLRIYSTATGKEDTRFDWGTDCGAVQFSPDSRLIAYDIGNFDRSVRTKIIEFQTGREVSSVTGELTFGGNNFSDDSRRIFTHDTWKQQTTIWTLDESLPKATVEARYAPVGQFSPFPHITRMRSDYLFHEKLLGAYDCNTGANIWHSFQNGSMTPTGDYALHTDGRQLLDGASGKRVLSLSNLEIEDPVHFRFANTRPAFVAYRAPNYLRPPEGDFDAQLWQRRRPEAWWGLAWLAEFWLAAGVLSVLIWSVLRDRRS